MATELHPSLRVDAHVLVQLGKELVTDVEQAILECVKNAYDADAPGCLIKVRTEDQGVLEEDGEFARLGKFCRPAENVSVSLQHANGRAISLAEDGTPTENVGPNVRVQRRLQWTGSILIEDQGAGLSEQQVRDSWLVISSSAKRARAADNRKQKTAEKRRIPLGDKGLGRLGTMKLGDILEVQTASGGSSSLSNVRFRWADCDAAFTVDQIPVHFEKQPNLERMKGTQVYVRGLKDLEDWKRPGRASEITRAWRS